MISKSAPRPRTLPSRVDNKELHRETRTIIANFDQEHQEPLGRAKLDNNHVNMFVLHVVSVVVVSMFVMLSVNEENKSFV